MVTPDRAPAQAPKTEPFAHMPRNLFSIKLSGTAAWQVLGCILSYADVDGTGARPKIDTIVAETGLSRRAVYYAISELEELGLLARQPRRKDGRQTSNWYAIDKAGCKAGCNSVHPTGCNSVAPYRPDPFLPDPSATNVAAFSDEPKTQPGPPSRLLERVEKLLGWERTKKGARTLGVQWHGIIGTEDLEAAIVAAEADPYDDGTSSFEFFMNEFEEMGYSYSAGEFAPICGPRRKKPKSKQLVAEEMPSIRELKEAARTEPERSLQAAWPKIERKAYGYALARNFKPNDFQDLAETFADRHQREQRSDWLLAWRGFIGRRARNIEEADRFQKYGYVHY